MHRNVEICGSCSNSRTDPRGGLLISLPQVLELEIKDVIYQTRGRVFPPISKHRKVGWKNEVQPSFF